MTTTHPPNILSQKTVITQQILNEFSEKYIKIREQRSNCDTISTLHLDLVFEYLELILSYHTLVDMVCDTFRNYLNSFNKIIVYETINFIVKYRYYANIQKIKEYYLKIVKALVALKNNYWMFTEDYLNIMINDINNISDLSFTITNVHLAHIISLLLDAGMPIQKSTSFALNSKGLLFMVNINNFSVVNDLLYYQGL